MKTSHLKKGLLWTGVTTLVLFVVLVVHLILVLKPKVYDNNHMQLVKVDFPENIDTTERSLMLSKVKSMQGVKTVNFYSEQNALVAMYDNTIQNNEKVMATIKSVVTSPAVLFKPSAEMLASGCPIKNKDSYSYKFSMFIKNVFY